MTSNGSARDRQRILIISPGGLEHGGGIGRQVGYLMESWRGLDEAPAATVLDPRGPGHIIWSPLHLLRTLGALATARINHGRTLLHINVAGRGSTVRKLIIAAFASALGHPFVIHLHDYNYRRFYGSLPAPGRAAIRAMFRAAERVLVLGNGDYQLAIGALGVDRARTLVLHNAAPAPNRSMMLAPEARPNNGARLLFLGRLSERKGVPELLEALASPEVRRLSWTAVFAGDGPVDQFRARARTLGIDDRLSFTGWVDQAGTARLLGEADLLALPSHDEGMPMAVLEALAHGLLVVCTPVGALGEVIEDQTNGLVVAPGDVAGLAAALARAFTEPELRLRLGAAAERTFQAQFEISAYGKRMTEIYREAPRYRPTRTESPVTPL